MAEEAKKPEEQAKPEHPPAAKPESEQRSVTDALAMLDPENDEHWTDDNYPKLEAVSALAGRQVARDEILRVGPGMTRKRKAPPQDLASERAQARSRGEKRFLELNDEIAAQQELANKAKDKLDALVAEQASLQRFDPTKTGHSHMDNQARIMNHIKANQDRRIRMHEDKRKRAESLGLKHDPRSPIDKALGDRPKQRRTAAR